MTRLLLISALLLAALLCRADHGVWRMYLSYGGHPAAEIVSPGLPIKTQDIRATDKFIFVQVHNGLYSYKRSDGEVMTYSRLNLLSDIEVQQIAWCKAKKKLVVLYKTGNIDLLCDDCTRVENIASYYLKPSTNDKTVNRAVVVDDVLLLCTNFGVVKVNLTKAEISESYILGKAFQKAIIKNNVLYALTLDGAELYVGDMRRNLLDTREWTKEAYTGQVDFTTDNDLEAGERDKQIIDGMNLDDSPRCNQISALLWDNGRLLVAAGGMREDLDNQFNYNTPFVSEYRPGEGWRHWDAFVSALSIRGFREVSQFAVDPSNKEHVFVGTAGNGVHEYISGKHIKNFTKDNSDGVIGSASSSNNYVLVHGVLMNEAGSLYMLNSQSMNSLLHYDMAKFKSLNKSQLHGLQGDPTRSLGCLEDMMLDKNTGNIWFVNSNYQHPALYFYSPSQDAVAEYSVYKNQDGTTYNSITSFTSPVFDLDGNLWIGTSHGPFMYTPDLLSNPKAGFYQVKIPRQDGSGYADYLLSGVNITTIAIDGGGRKWLGTSNNGIYVISADNMEQVEHFTVENSYLLSNEIKAIAINDASGEVFIGTAKGLCSYMSDASKPSDSLSKDNVWAYPNPVKGDFQGYVTITGLSLAARITITTTSGTLVAQGVSVGGSFKWDVKDADGNRVAPGIYMVHAATSAGESGVVCKVAVVE